LSEREIADRLDDRFQFLEGGDWTVAPRHQTLRAMMDWSYELLLPPERVLLRRLSISVGNWTLPATERICSGEGLEQTEIERLLSGLIASSLVVSEEWKGERRFRLLETVRQYGQERSEALEQEQGRRRYCDYYLQLAEASEAQRSNILPAVWI